MACRFWRGGLLAIVAGTMLASCLPEAARHAAASVAERQANSPPMIAGSPAVSATAGIAWLFQPTAADPDGDALTFSASGMPGWMAIDTRTGLMSGTPSAFDVGVSTPIVVTVSDREASSSLRAFSLVISAPATSSPLPDAPLLSGTAALSWLPPVQYSDGSTLRSGELAGYRVYRGTNTAALTRIAEVDSGTLAFTVQGLAAGTHYFAVTAVSVSGSESGYSEIASKTIQ
jgi:hypothetical protein